MSHVTYLGNPAPHEAKTEEGRVVGTTPLEGGPSVTEVHWQPEIAAELKRHADQIDKALTRGKEAVLLRIFTAEGLAPWEVALKHVLSVVSAHAAEGISWVAGEDDKLEAILSKLLEAEQAPHGTASALKLAKEEEGSWDEITSKLHGPTALKTKAGVDLIHAAVFGTAAQPAAANYIALTANNEAESASNTSLAGEITTSEGGLIRKQATYAHTTGATTATLTVTFTANSHDSLPVTVNKFGVFNKATSGGTLAIETKITAATFNAEGDNTVLSEVITVT